mgnify:CR=1 FL=1
MVCGDCHRTLPCEPSPRSETPQCVIHAICCHVSDVGVVTSQAADKLPHLIALVQVANIAVGVKADT